MTSCVGLPASELVEIGGQFPFVFLRDTEFIDVMKRRIHDAVVVLYHAQILYVDDIGLMDLYKSVIICT